MADNARLFLVEGPSNRESTEGDRHGCAPYHLHAV